MPAFYTSLFLKRLQQGQLLSGRLTGRLTRRASVLLAAMLLSVLSSTVAAQASETAIATAATDRQAEPVVLVLGDSLSAAYGIEEDGGWVALLQESLSEAYHGIHVVNGSISGETTDGGLYRLPEALKKFEPDLVIIELGGNDGLRGKSLKQLRQNLTAMVRMVQDTGADALILGMRIPTNYGAVYTERFFNAFQRVADETGAALVPFFLEPIAHDISLFQPDGIHPSAEAQPLLLNHVLPTIETLLKQPPR